MSDDRPVLNQVNLVVRDMDAMVEFYRRLGAEIAPTVPPWDQHHRTVWTPEGLGLDLDSPAFATQWDQGWPAGHAGAVIGFGVERRETVDAIYAGLTNGGYVGRQPPYDAFWGARYAVIVDPDGNSVGIMSAVDPTRTCAPPTP